MNFKKGATSYCEFGEQNLLHQRSENNLPVKISLLLLILHNTGGKLLSIWSSFTTV
jgi:hypothetical protein